MRSSFDVSVGLTTPNGTRFGIRVKCEVNTLVADRNADAALDGQKTGGGSPACDKRPSGCAARSFGDVTE
jgi:hypothetical protein